MNQSAATMSIIYQRVKAPRTHDGFHVGTVGRFLGRFLCCRRRHYTSTPEWQCHHPTVKLEWLKRCHRIILNDPGEAGYDAKDIQQAYRAFGLHMATDPSNASPTTTSVSNAPLVVVVVVVVVVIVVVVVVVITRLASCLVWYQHLPAGDCSSSSSSCVHQREEEEEDVSTFPWTGRTKPNRERVPTGTNSQGGTDHGGWKSLCRILL